MEEKHSSDELKTPLPVLLPWLCMYAGPGLPVAGTVYRAVCFVGGNARREDRLQNTQKKVEKRSKIFTQ